MRQLHFLNIFLKILILIQDTKLYLDILFFDFGQHQEYHLNAGFPVDGNPLIEKSNLGIGRFRV